MARNFVQLPDATKLDTDRKDVNGQTVDQEIDRLGGEDPDELADVRNADPNPDDGGLVVRPLTPAAFNPVNDYQTSAALAAGATATLTSSAADGKKLAGLDVWTTVAYKVSIHTFDDDVGSNPLAVGGGQAYQPFMWRTPTRGYISLGSTAGTDAFRALVTNLDDANPADIFAVFHYED